MAKALVPLINAPGWNNDFRVVEDIFSCQNERRAICHQDVKKEQVRGGNIGKEAFIRGVHLLGVLWYFLLNDNDNDLFHQIYT